MFDIYPVINKSDTFIEFFYDAFVWSFLLHPFIWILVFISIFLSKYIVAVFHRKVIAYSLLFFIPIFLIFLCLISIHLGNKPSNDLLYGTIFIMPIVAFCIIMFIQSSRLKDGFQYQKETVAYKFQGLPAIYQIVFLIMLFMLFFMVVFVLTIKHVFTNPSTYYFLSVLPIFLVYTFLIYKKIPTVESVKISFKSSDYIPLAIIAVFLILVSFLKVGDVICIIPIFNCYFSCGNC